MKTIHRHLIAALALLAFSILDSQLSTAQAQGTAFTYQGQLVSGGGPANGHYDFTFTLYNNSSANTGQVGGGLTNSDVGVTNGLFTVVLDFGANFPGANRWLAIGVRTNGGGSFAGLSPLQELLPTPYAVYASNAGAAASANSVAAANISGAIALAQLPATVSLLSDPGTGNFFAGPSAGNLTLNGTDNTGFGDRTFFNITSGNYNTATGVAALEADTTGSANSAFGDDAMGFNSTGSNNVAVGADALGFNGSGYNNTAVGYAALVLNTSGNNNTATGNYAMGGATGTSGGNTANGGYTLYDITTGYNNTAAGFDALYGDSTGVDNVGIGVSTFYGNSQGSQNTAVGTYAFQNMTAGSGNVGLGYYAGNSLVAGTNNIYIGNAGSSADNEVIRIGSGQSKTFIAGSAVGINNNNPTAALDVGGEYLVVEGLTPIRCYFGDDGSGQDVQIGSLKSGITAVSLYNEADNDYMHLYCSSITIEGGSDLAEPFPISTTKQKVCEGAVVVIDEANPGQLKLADQPYDTRVAGVVSGANGVNPGIQMQQQGLLEGGKNVALTGRVYVMADAANGAIRPGDLLTTSSAPGRAMKVSDHVRGQGAILGKAMSELKQGQGMVLVLVTLQ